MTNLLILPVFTVLTQIEKFQRTPMMIDEACNVMLLLHKQNIIKLVQFKGPTATLTF